MLLTKCVESFWHIKFCKFTAYVLRRARNFSRENLTFPTALREISRSDNFSQLSLKEKARKRNTALIHTRARAWLHDFKLTIYASERREVLRKTTKLDFLIKTKKKSENCQLNPTVKCAGALSFVDKFFIKMKSQLHSRTRENNILSISPRVSPSVTRLSRGLTILSNDAQSNCESRSLF